MPLTPEVMLRRTVSVSCPEWGSHFWEYNSPSIHSARIDCAPWLRCPEVPGQGEESQAGFTPGPRTNKGQELQPGDTPLMTEGYLWLKPLKSFLPVSQACSFLLDYPSQPSLQFGGVAASPINREHKEARHPFGALGSGVCLVQTLPAAAS